MKHEVYSSFKDIIYGADLADMQLISKFNKGFRFLLCVIHIYSNYAWVVPLRNKIGITITNAFQKVLHESGRKPNKIWAYKGSEFYNRSMKTWLKDNDIEMYSTHKERFIRTLKTKISKYVTLIAKNAYIDKLDNMVNKCNNTYNRTIKVKPADIKSST